MAVSNATLHAKLQAHEKRIDDLAAALASQKLTNATFLSHLSQMARVSDSTSTIGQVTAQFNLLVDRMISAGYMS
jgi:uncharacterized coiled-coil protein SlyX